MRVETSPPRSSGLSAALASDGVQQPTADLTRHSERRRVVQRLFAIASLSVVIGSYYKSDLDVKSPLVIGTNLARTQIRRLSNFSADSERSFGGSHQLPSVSQDFSHGVIPNLRGRVGIGG
jgi:hypothetical protein